MPSTVWKGYLTFGLVSIPVRLIRAARAERVPLKQLYRPSRDAHTQQQPFVSVEPVRRVYEPMESVEESAPVRPAELVKGFEFEKGQYVVLEDREIQELTPQKSTEMQIVEFVRFEEIDPVYLETSYYVTPDGDSEKSYALLLEAMRSSGYAAIGQVTMHRRDHVMIVRPGKTGLIAHTMFYPDEVRSIHEFRTDTSMVVAKEMNLAKSLIEVMAKPFEPSQFKNSFRERLQQLIDARIEGQEVAHVAQSPGAPSKVVDIMEALKRSLAQAAADRKPAGAEKKPTSANRKNVTFRR